MKPRLPLLKLLSGQLIGAAPCLPAAALTNPEFAAEVRTWRAQMTADAAVVGEVALLCAYLPEHRAVEEPRCVALRGHLRSQAVKARDATRIGASGVLPGGLSLSFELRFG